VQNCPADALTLIDQRALSGLVKNAREEGAEFEFNVQPVNLELDKKGRVCGIRLLRTELGEPDAQGRRRPVPIAGSEFVMPADAVIMAFGFHPHSMPLPDQQPENLCR